MYAKTLKPRVVGIVPARLAATRLPNKPLVDIAGRPMLQHVWDRAKLAECLTDLVVATPDAEIETVVQNFGGQVVMTSAYHRSGTDRLAEASVILHLDDQDIVVNIQGDEPLLEPGALEKVVEPLMLDPQITMTSVMCPCPEEDQDNPACVKVVCNLQGNALYFSRSQVPYVRSKTSNQDSVGVMQHVGLYGYRVRFLRFFATLKPTPLELTESLEQLRVLENGYPIRMVQIATAPIGVDTPDDLERVRQLIR